MPLKIDELPKEPSEAFKALALSIRKLIPANSNKKWAEFKTDSRAKSLEIRNQIKMMQITSVRISDTELHEIMHDLYPIDDDKTLSALDDEIERALDTILATQFTTHFSDDAETIEFDRAEIDSQTRGELFEIMKQARDEVQKADYLSANHKRRLLFRISKVEEEIYKEKAGFGVFLAAASEASDLLKKFGQDAAPLADAIQKARTVTQRKVEGYPQIEKDKSPKQLPAPGKEKG